MEEIQLFILNIIKSHGANALCILVLFFGGRIVLKKMVKRMIRLAEDEDKENKSDMEKRAETLGSIMINTGNIAIYIS